MIDRCGRFELAVNLAGKIDFQYAWQLFLYVFYMPAKVTLYLIDQWPALGRFFQLDCAQGDSWGGAVYSFYVYFLLWGYFAELSRGRKSYRMRDDPGVE